MKNKKIEFALGLLVVIIVSIMILLNNVIAANPQPPDIVLNPSNETRATPSAKKINISGGYIATLNISATIQNPRWKAFIGWVNGEFTLQDAGGSTIYDWSMTVTNGRVYATRSSSSPSWSSIECANTSVIEQENTNMNLTNTYDNITATFDGVNHSSFWVGGTHFNTNACNHTLNTYVNNQSQTGLNQVFDEITLYDGSNIVYATILEDDEVGYDGNNYDFQMLVPERGDPGFSGATAYYLYIEIS